MTARIEYRTARLADQMRSHGTRAVIEQAKGMLISARRCTPDEAFEILTEASMRTNRKLRDIAVAMVHGAKTA